MASINRVIGRVVLFFMRLCDYFLNIFGIKLFPINLKSVLQGLSPEEVEESKDPTISAPLGLFLDCLEKATSQNLDVVGRMVAKETLHDILRKRVAIKRTLREHPDILDVPIRRPIIIAGAPRSGTTLLFRLIAEDPQFMAPMMWEQFAPYPPGRPQNWRESSRFKKAVEDIDALREIMDSNMDMIHEFRPDLPEECTFPMERSLNLHRFVLTLPTMKPFEDWVYSRGHQYYKDMYSFQRKTLQMIGYKDLESRHLVLKSFFYLYDLEATQEVFPGACLVITRRNLKQSVASSILMFSALADALGGKVTDTFSKELLKGLAWIESRAISHLRKFDDVPEDERPFFDLEYSDLVKDPISAVRNIYKHFKFPFTEEAERRMRAYLADNPQHKHGRPKYSLEGYGLTEQDIREAMGPYIEYYKDKGHKLF